MNSTPVAFHERETYKLFCRGLGKGDLPGFQPCRGLWTFLRYDETYCYFEQYTLTQNTWAIPHTMVKYYKATATTTDTPELHPDSLEQVQ